MKNAESIMAAFYYCCLVEENNLFTETLNKYNFTSCFIDSFSKVAKKVKILLQVTSHKIHRKLRSLLKKVSPGRSIKFFQKSSES